MQRLHDARCRASRSQGGSALAFGRLKASRKSESSRLFHDLHRAAARRQALRGSRGRRSGRRPRPAAPPPAAGGGRAARSSACRATFVLVRHGAELVHVRRHDRADQVLQVVAVRDEVLRQRVQQRGRCVGGLEARKSSTGWTMPRPISSPQTRLTIARAKNGLSGRVSQSAERLPRVASAGIAGYRRRPGGLGFITSPVSGCLHVAPARREPDELGLAGDRGGDALALALELAEERGELVEVVLAPLLVRVVVALGALDPHAQEELADDRRDVRRLAAVAEQDDRAVAVRAPLGGEDLADELVVRLVLRGSSAAATGRAGRRS